MSNINLLLLTDFESLECHGKPDLWYQIQYISSQNRGGWELVIQRLNSIQTSRSYFPKIQELPHNLLRKNQRIGMVCLQINLVTLSCKTSSDTSIIEFLPIRMLQQHILVFNCDCNTLSWYVLLSFLIAVVIALKTNKKLKQFHSHLREAQKPTTFLARCPKDNLIQ